MPKLLLATSNPGKQREYRQLLAGVGWDLVTPQELGLALTDEEGRVSYEDNAVAKAQSAARASGLVALADDSGLEVDALGGEPGPFSARFAGPNATDDQRLQYLLARLAEVPPQRRQARFRCVIAIVQPSGQVATCEGTCEGVIAPEPSGADGFGYDPIFYLPQQGLTMAELSAQEKNAISHRARAAQKARALLSSIPAHPSTGSE
ncbi:MAG: RdgB/HAM1 family non-canonical purine NTP pyrophosphatase [Dehalococcoidia bacterium]